MEIATIALIKRKINLKKILLTILKYFLLLLFSLFFMFPFIVMICYSFLPDSEAMQSILLSEEGIINVYTYLNLLTDSIYLNYIKNTVIVTALSCLGVPFSASLCAYSFSKLKYKSRNVLFSTVLATLMLPGIVTQIPLYVLYVKLGWYNTLFPLWVPGLFGGGATNIFLMTQFMRGIPNDLSNAAKIDGANNFEIFYKMILPLCMPVYLFVMINTFMASWNDFMTPLLYIVEKSKYTLSLGIYKDYGQVNSTSLPNQIMAAGVIMMLPCLLLFFLFQKSLIEGVSVTGLKG